MNGDKKNITELCPHHYQISRDIENLYNITQSLIEWKAADHTKMRFTEEACKEIKGDLKEIRNCLGDLKKDLPINYATKKELITAVNKIESDFDKFKSRLLKLLGMLIPAAFFLWEVARSVFFE